MQLTDASIKALKPKATRYLVSDGEGLSLDVLPSGKMSWFFRYRHPGGKQEKVTLGQYPAMTLKVARNARKQMGGKVAAGGSPAQETKARRAGVATNPTLFQFGERYYIEQVVKTWKDPKDIRRYLSNEIYPTLGEKLLKDVTVLEVQALVHRKRDNGRPQAAMKLLSAIKQMFGYALELQLVTQNPAAQIATRYIGKARKGSRVLTAAEIRLYLRTVYQSNMRRQFKLALHIILLTLVRKSELLLARWEHINFEAGEWLIPAENAKTAKPHIVYMSTQVAEMFRELKGLSGGSELAMPGRSSLVRPFAANALNKALEGLTFDMDPLTIHDLRRTGATLLTEKGFDRDVIEKALSHERQGIRAVYVLAEHAAERKRMLQWWGDYVDGIVNESNVILGNFGAAKA